MTTAAPLRAALQALLQFQTRVNVAGLPPYGAERLNAELALFPTWCVQREFGRTWTEAEQALWARVLPRLVDSALAQPQLAVRGGVPVAGDEGAGDAVAGPATYDLVALLRDGGWPADETEELDLAIRWWDQARRAGLPVEADFGECWRALEWMGLQRHLMLLGRLCRERHEAGADADAAFKARLQVLLDAASRVALRYAPLKPLLRLLQPLQGSSVEAGYTF